MLSLIAVILSFPTTPPTFLRVWARRNLNVWMREEINNFTPTENNNNFANQFSA